MICKLALEDGSVFTGTSLGTPGTRTGEVVFNTAMTGYQEVFTDPSYCGQIVVMTFPMMGNYGVNDEDFESRRPFLSGIAVRDVPPRPSNFRSTASLPEFLTGKGLPGISGIDTRAVVRRIRTQGALRGVISTEILDEVELVRRAQNAPPMAGSNWVTQVTSDVAASWTRKLQHLASVVNAATLATPAPESRKCHMVALDCGIKHNMLRHLCEVGCRVTTVPATTTAEALRELDPDGILIGNGPGDPAAVPQVIETLRAVIGTVPILGICLGHQLLALALGAKTYKLRFGHHGANVPVLNKPADRVEITSQNHGFAVDAESLAQVGGTLTHINLNDGSVEGFVHEDRRLLAVQFHPEAAPGPNDAAYIFARFAEAVENGQAINTHLLETRF